MSLDVHQKDASATLAPTLLAIHLQTAATVTQVFVWMEVVTMNPLLAIATTATHAPFQTHVKMGHAWESLFLAMHLPPQNAHPQQVFEFTTVPEHAHKAPAPMLQPPSPATTTTRVRSVTTAAVEPAKPVHPETATMETHAP